MIRLVLIEDNERLRQALGAGLAATGEVQVDGGTARGEEVPSLFEGELPDAALMDVRLAGAMNGIQAATALRRLHPRFPVVFYSIQDDDDYFRAFRASGILSHYAYVRKSNYLLPSLIVPLLRDAIDGRSFIDPEIEARVQEVRFKDERDPMALLEPNERVVVGMLARGLTNEQIAARLGYADKRTISRTNGMIYTAWGLVATASDEKIARTRAVLIARSRRLISWDSDGLATVIEESGRRVTWEPE